MEELFIKIETTDGGVRFLRKSDCLMAIPKINAKGIPIVKLLLKESPTLEMETDSLFMQYNVMKEMRRAGLIGES